jgi:hypothetical protein
VPRRSLPLPKKIAFALIPLLAFLLFGECVARLARGPLYFESFRLTRIDQVRRGYPAMPDPELGYVPRPGAATDDSRWGTTVSIDADGFRSNGQPRPARGRTIVAVGDSFTFGDQVHDHESWPAALERELERPTVNAGVFGYSLGQAVLRAERVLANTDAEWLVLGLFEDDIHRNEFSKRYSPIPCFDAVDGKLVVHPPGFGIVIDAEEQASRDLKNLLGYSALLEAVLYNVAPAWWLTNEKEHRALPIGRGAASSLLLIDRLAASCAARGCRLAVVLIGAEAGDAARQVMERASGHGAVLIDLSVECAKDPELAARMFDGHLSVEGNAWTARLVADALRAAG